jgi:hypothetical protein
MWPKEPTLAMPTKGIQQEHHFHFIAPPPKLMSRLKRDQSGERVSRQHARRGTQVDAQYIHKTAN